MNHWILGLIMVFSAPFARAVERDCAKEAFNLDIGWLMVNELRFSLEVNIEQKVIPKNLADVCKDSDFFNNAFQYSQESLESYKKSQLELARNKTMSVEHFLLGSVNTDHLPAEISNQDLCEIVDKSVSHYARCLAPRSYLESVTKSNILFNIKGECPKYIQEISGLIKKCK